jgi:hypothetical protein
MDFFEPNRQVMVITLYQVVMRGLGMEGDEAAVSTSKVLPRPSFVDEASLGGIT